MDDKIKSSEIIERMDQELNLTYVIEIPIKDDNGLIKVIRVVSELYLNYFKEEGEAEIYSDIDCFPPVNIPESTDSLEFQLCKAFPILEEGQSNELMPYKIYRNQKFYLLAQNYGDCDQLLAFTDKVYLLNKNFKIITYLLEPRDLEGIRIPEVEIHIVRGKIVKIYFIMLETNYQNKFKKTHSAMKKILTMARNNFIKIYQNPTPLICNSFSELYIDE